MKNIIKMLIKFNEYDNELISTKRDGEDSSLTLVPTTIIGLIVSLYVT
jgi:hypothetical protein